MAKYIDGFVLVVPKGKESEYEEMAKMGRDSWMKHGALQYFECRGDDLKQQEMGDLKSRAFAEMAGANSDENVWFSFIVFNFFFFVKVELLSLTLCNTVKSCPSEKSASISISEATN